MNAERSPYRILVVEDEPTFLKFLEVLLKSAGYVPVGFADPTEAFTALDKGHFDLVITDKNLPGGLSGLDVLRRVKETVLGLDVILTTAHADVRTAVEAFKLGAYDYVLKPFESNEDALHRVARALEKRQIWLDNQSLIQRLEAANESLEAQVAERTRELEMLTVEDDVTGLYNQRFLFQRLPGEIDRARRYKHELAVLMLDVDHFKRVNDQRDHLFGSAALRKLGLVFQECVRTVDFVIRYGGDEFCFILPDTDTKGATVLAERLRQRVAESNIGDEETPYRATVSIGVASLTDHPQADAQGLLKAADLALYEAKRAGRNTVSMAPSAQESA